MSILAIEPTTAGSGPFHPAAWYMDEDGRSTSHVWPEEFETEEAAYELAKSRADMVNEAANAAFQRTLGAPD